MKGTVLSIDAIFGLLATYSIAFSTMAHSQGYPTTDEGYALPSDIVPLEFPKDHGSHPEFKSEWWYLTGHLEGPDPADKYGFQLTFFRSASVPVDQEPIGTQPHQIYMAHAAILDKTSEKYIHEERFNREEWNADAQINSLLVYNGNWELAMTDSVSEKMRASFSVNSDSRLNASLLPLKPKVLFGKNGVSRKGENFNAKSYYITFSRLEVSGTLEVGDNVIPITGYAWMDHEISSSQLSEGQIGWNWTSLILDDGTELMAYVMRRGNGSKDPYSQMHLIDPSGGTKSYSAEQFSWVPIEYWISPRSGARYPIHYRISWIDQLGETQTITVRSTPDDQEISGRISGFTYYEGAGVALDEDGQEIGKSYTELTGYDASLFGRF